MKSILESSYSSIIESCLSSLRKAQTGGVLYIDLIANLQLIVNTHVKLSKKYYLATNKSLYKELDNIEWELPDEAYSYVQKLKSEISKFGIISDNLKKRLTSMSNAAMLLEDMFGIKSKLNLSNIKVTRVELELNDVLSNKTTLSLKVYHKSGEIDNPILKGMPKNSFSIKNLVSSSDSWVGDEFCHSFVFRS